MLAKLRPLVDRLLEGALAIIMGGMVLAVSWQVMTRFVLRDPSSGTEELVRFGLVWLGLLGASYGFGKRAHLTIELFLRRGPLDVLIQAIIAVFALAVLIIGGGQLVHTTLALGQTSTALSIERGYVYVALPLSGALILFYAISAVVEGKR